MRSPISKIELASALAAHRPRRFHDRPWLTHAAVAVVVRRGSEVLLVERAKRRGDRWSGQVAFPGGVAQTADVHLAATAERETREETGLDLAASGEHIGRLSELPTLGHQGRPMAVAPFVYWLNEDMPLALSDELSQSFWLSLRSFASIRTARTRSRRALGWALPVAGFEIGPSVLWGLSLMMLDELADVIRRARLL
jgi:8-oxo-dGTP pyrophosphatase MutT (NUDIX family)